MEKLNQILSTIFYLIWIPLGIFLIAGIIFLIVANPIGSLLQSLPSGVPAGGGFAPPGGGLPSQEQIQQFQQQGPVPGGTGQSGPSGKGQFGPPNQ